eukprot:7095477-Pyramimonas_sp.AAC.1
MRHTQASHKHHPCVTHQLREGHEHEEERRRPRRHRRPQPPQPRGKKPALLLKGPRQRETKSETAPPAHACKRRFAQSLANVDAMPSDGSE